MPKLSIITINYNNVNGLEKTIASVINQTYADFEFIIVDGGSTDTSIDQIKKNASKITYWCSENDKGIYDAQNKGLDVAKGDYCLFLNSGDYLFNKDVLQKVIDAEFTTDIIACNMIFDYGTKKIEKQQPDSVSFFYMMDTSVWHPATFIKTSLFQKLGKYKLNYKIAADYDFFLNAIIVNNATYKHLNLTLSVFDTSGASSDINYITNARKEERLAIQKQYFSEQLINEADKHNQLMNSNSYKLFSILKNNTFLYTIGKNVFNPLLSIKRFFNK
jgi:glycosyltransferase involved in cell wall biosynthesis